MVEAITLFSVCIITHLPHICRQLILDILNSQYLWLISLEDADSVSRPRLTVLAQKHGGLHSLSAPPFLQTLKCGRSPLT